MSGMASHLRVFIAQFLIECAADGDYARLGKNRVLERSFIVAVRLRETYAEQPARKWQLHRVI